MSEWNFSGVCMRMSFLFEVGPFVSLLSRVLPSSEGFRTVHHAKSEGKREKTPYLIPCPLRPGCVWLGTEARHITIGSTRRVSDRIAMVVQCVIVFVHTFTQYFKFQRLHG